MGQNFSWNNVSQFFTGNNDDSRYDQGQDDVRAQSIINAMRSTCTQNSFRFVNVLFSCSIHQTIKEDFPSVFTWPWSIKNHFDNKLSSHVSLFVSGCSSKLITTVSGLFQYDNEIINKLSIESKTMFLIGSSGIGKTTLCEEIKYQWANKKILHDTNCLFLINLDDSTLKKICSLDDLAYYSELPYKCAIEFLGNDNSDVTIIIDGYKQFSDHDDNTFINRLIERRILKQCRLIITVHPGAFERLQKLVNASINVQLLGFDADGINVYIQQMLVGHPDKITTLLSYLDENSRVKGLCYIPTLLKILIEFVKEHKSLPSDYNAMELAISHFLWSSNNSFQKKSGIDHFLHLSKLSFDSIRTRQLTDLCNFGCLCVQEYLAADYIAKLNNPCKQFELLKNLLFRIDVFGSWTQLNIDNIGHFRSHSIFCNLELKSDISYLSDLLRFYSVYAMFDYFKSDESKICNEVVFQALCFMHSEEIYYRLYPGFIKHEDWYYNDRAYDMSLHSLYCWSKVYISLWNTSSSNSGIELILFYKYEVDLSFYQAIRQLLRKQHVAVLVRNYSTLLGYRTSSHQLVEGLELSHSLNTLVLKFCHISDDIVDNLRLEKLESLLISDCKWNGVNSSIISIFQMLKKICTLRNLNLSCNNLSGEAVAKDLADIIHNNGSITTLYLGNNNLKSMAIVVLQALKKISTLKVLDLDNNNMSGEVSEELASVINNNPHLEELHLSNNDLRSSVTVVLHAIQKHSKLQLLNLNENKIPDTVGENIAVIIKHNTSLKDLRLGFNNLKSSIVPVLLALKEPKPLLGVLNLNGIGMSEEVANLVGDVIHNQRCLKELHLSNNNLHSSTAVIVQALKNAIRQSLRILNLSNNNIPEEVAQLLADTIKMNRYSLEELHLGSNNLKSSACLVIEALKDLEDTRSPRRLRTLNLNNNNMSGKVVELLHDVIRKNRLLEELHLSNNNFQQSAVVFLQALKLLSRLKVLNLNGNKMSGKVAKYLGHVIENNRYYLQSIHLGFNNMRSSLSLVLQSLETVSHLKVLNLSGNYMTDTAAQHVACVIKANVHLEVLRLSCNDFQDLQTSVWFIFEALKGISSLKILDMSNNNLSSDGEKVIENLADVINNNNHLEELRLSGNRLTLCSSDFVVLRALGSISSMKRLNLNCNKISGETGEYIAHVVTNNPCIEELSLSHNYLHSSIVSILRSLSKISHLRKLNLSCNSISGVTVAEGLATVIANNTCLEELTLGNNNFHLSAVVILRALQRTNGLKILDLSNNNIIFSENAGELLANIVKSNVHLRDLHLGFNKLQSSDVVIVKALQVISTLRTLHLNGNYISVNAGEYLAVAIKSNKNLEDLRLSNNNFQESISLVLEALAKIDHLKVLHLSNNNIKGRTAKSLALAVENNMSLEEVCLPSNSFHNSADKILQALKKLSKLKKLNLNDNNMSSGVSSDLAKVIASNNSLSDLLLSNNNLQSSALVVFEALIRTSEMSLNVAEQLASVIHCNLNLEELFLFNNDLGSSVNLILQALRRNNKIKALDLRCNNISDDVVESLVEFIHHNNTLMHLNLDSNNLQEYTHIFKKTNSKIKITL